jgi:hypothetical protein
VDAALQLMPVVPEPTDFESLQAEWIPEHSRRPRQGSGRPLSKTAVAGLWATNARLVQYQQARGTVLRVESMDLSFYQDFLTYVVDELGQSVNTFGKHIDRLKAFLTWCEEEKDLPVHRHYRRFVATRKCGRVDALTEAELRRVAGLSFKDTDTRTRLLETARAGARANQQARGLKRRALDRARGAGPRQVLRVLLHGPAHLRC